MNRSEELRKSRDVYTVAWREFLVSQSSDSKTVFCFFEGEDNKYYIGRLKPILNPNATIRPLVCGGKSGVVRVNQLWGQKFDGAKTPPKSLFFLDRDFDSRSKFRFYGMAYVTPCYSIENLFVSEACVSAILENEFGVHTIECITSCAALNLFDTLLKEFLDASTLINAWIFLHRKHESLNPGVEKLNLNNVGFNELFKVTLSGVERLYSESSLASLFPKARTIDVEELRRYERWFQCLDRRRICRGKYLVEFLRKALEIIKADRVSTTPRWFPQKKTVKLGLSRENIISELCQYADTPPCLARFIRQLDSQPLFGSQ